MKEKRLLMALITITTIFLGAVIYLIASNNTADVSTYNTTPVVDYSNNQNDKIDYDSIEEDFESIKTTTQEFNYDYSSFESSLNSLIEITAEGVRDLLTAEEEYNNSDKMEEAKWTYYWKINDIILEYRKHYEKFLDSEDPIDEEGLKLKRNAMDMYNVFEIILERMLIGVKDESYAKYEMGRAPLQEFTEVVLKFVEMQVYPYLDTK